MKCAVECILLFILIVTRQLCFIDIFIVVKTHFAEESPMNSKHIQQSDAKITTVISVYNKVKIVREGPRGWKAHTPAHDVLMSFADALLRGVLNIVMLLFSLLQPGIGIAISLTFQALPTAVCISICMRADK